MATQLFLLSTAASTHRGTNTATIVGAATGWDPRALGLSRGSGVTATANVATVTGTTNGIEVTNGTVPYEWLSEPVAADVTISGTITANIWAAESSMTANVAIDVIIDIVRSDSSNTIVQIVKSTFATELNLTTRTANNFTTGMTSGGYSSQTLNRGDRLRIRVFGDDGGGTMATGFTFNAGFAGTTAAADGDSYVTFTENITFESAPAGSVIYLTNEQSGLSGAPALISDFTGADENPLSEGGNWAQLDTGRSQMRRISNELGASAASLCWSYWTPQTFGPDVEVYATIAVHSGAPTLALRIQSPGGTNVWDGYRTYYNGSAMVITRMTNNAGTDLVTTSPVTLAAGDKIGFSSTADSLLTVWRIPSGESNWVALGSVVDTTHATTGNVAIGADNTTSRFDDFYAGSTSGVFPMEAWTSRGAGVVSARSRTIAGFTTPLTVADWYTKQLQAVTLTGLAQANIRALESNALNNATVRCEIARVESDGTSPTVWASWCMSADNTRTGELNTSETAETINVSGDDLAISDGQRLRIRLYADDMPTTAMAASTTGLTVYYNGTSGGASGDSYITFPVTLTELSAGGTTYTKAGYGKESG